MTNVPKSKANRYEVRAEGVKLQIIGPKQPHKDYAVYLRVESNTGEYLGSLDDEALKRFAQRLAEWVNVPGRAKEE